MCRRFVAALALGKDVAAHHGTLSLDGATVAVRVTGL